MKKDIKNRPKGIPHPECVFTSKAAFTLTEILFTLMIIAIIAIVTIPALINNYQERTTVTKVKKTYSILNQAVLMAIANNGQPSAWNTYTQSTYRSANAVMEKITPFLSISKDYGTANCGTCEYISAGKKLNNDNFTTYINSSSYYKMLLNDETYIWLSTATPYCGGNGLGYNNLCAYIYFDINGVKPPNTIGRDIFRIGITTDGVKPDSSSDITATGYGGLKYVLLNNNMNYLH